MLTCLHTQYQPLPLRWELTQTAKQPALELNLFSSRGEHSNQTFALLRQKKKQNKSREQKKDTRGKRKKTKVAEANAMLVVVAPRKRYQTRSSPHAERVGIIEGTEGVCDRASIAAGSEPR